MSEIAEGEEGVNMKVVGILAEMGLVESEEERRGLRMKVARKGRTESLVSKHGFGYSSGFELV